LIVEPPKKLRG